MVRVSYGKVTRKRHKRVLKAVKGARGGRSKLFKRAAETLDRGLVYAFTHRKHRKREFKRLWITRISAACRMAGTTYSKLINGLTKAKVLVDRKMMAELAVNDQKAFKELVEIAKAKA